MIDDPVASSRRVTAAFMEAQIAEMVRAGLGDYAWTGQLRECVERLRSFEPGPGESDTAARPALRLVGVDA